jgi:predicted DNA-binding protein (MmcQ/YjbR family)
MKKKNISDAVREVCLSLPESEEVVSHGSPDFRVRGKTFATYVVNHHGDGRIALWLSAPPGAQQFHVERSPKHYFVPPYVGPRGWLGVQLDKGLDWKRIAERVNEAYKNVAPKKLLDDLPPPIEIVPPSETLAADVVEPLAAPHAKKIVERLRKICLALPEARETTQFGKPVWQAGTKTFCAASRYKKQLRLSFWVGADQQDLLTMDPRFTVPAYTGKNGWIALDAEHGVDWKEVEGLVIESYRHFALKRMLSAWNRSR